MQKIKQMKKWIAGAGGALMLASFGAALPAAAETAAQPAAQSAAESRPDRQTRLEAAKEKWAALNDQQKKEIYDLLETKIQDDAALAEKLASLGIGDSEKAAAMKKHWEERLAKWRESGEFPDIGHPRRPGRPHTEASAPQVE